MPTMTAPKTDRWVTTLTKEGVFAVGGIHGLVIRVRGKSKQWFLRYRLNGKRRDLSLGPYPEITLGEARMLALVERKKIGDGIDPLAEKAHHKARIGITFEEASRQVIEAKRPEWKNAKHGAQWESTLAQYAFPVIGKMDLKEIDTPHILEILNGIWATKNETAARLRGRIEAVLSWGIARKYRDEPNPARWTGHLATMLAKPSKVQTVEHHKALPYDQIHGFIQKLHQRESISALALELVILTACRSGEVRLATWDEFNLEKRLWTIPAARMKGEKEHTVPLSNGALRVLKKLPRLGAYLFVGQKGKPLSDMALTQLMRGMGMDEVPHGFRSTFRDWAGETTAHPREVIEHALAHLLKDKAEASYARGTLLEKRARLMEDWSGYCDTPPATDAKVIQIREKQA
jgi:integrase